LRARLQRSWIMREPSALVSISSGRTRRGPADRIRGQATPPIGTPVPVALRAAQASSTRS
jgi:hypothetical protein